MTYDEMSEIVKAITYRPGWTILLKRDWSTEKGRHYGRPYVQIAVDETSDASLSPVTGQREPWRSGKHFLSPHMCRQEIVGAVFGAIKSAEEHEMREWFRYRGASIYNPHLDPDALVELARYRRNFNLRENAMSMEEG